MPRDPTRTLAVAAQRKREDALTRARAAIAELDQRGQTVTFKAVAARAGVSRQWLYQQPGLRAEIERLRALGRQRPSPTPARERSSEASLRQRVQTLLDENRRLRGDVRALREELAIAYGHQRQRALGA